MKTSGFSFAHNAIQSGYPIIEAIEAVKPFVDDIFVVDMQSTDDTREVLKRLDVSIIEGVWDCNAGETLAAAHALHTQCTGDVIIHFEADEVYDGKLLHEIDYQIGKGHCDLVVWRLQLEQNFQRIRWHPELVHRVFEKGYYKKQGHTTDRHQLVGADNKYPIKSISQEYGYLWDITNCFRDNWVDRINKQAELRQSEPQYLGAPLHIMDDCLMDGFQAVKFLDEPQWTWKHTPFNIPEILKPLLGVIDYRKSENYKKLMR